LKALEPLLNVVLSLVPSPWTTGRKGDAGSDDSVFGSRGTRIVIHSETKFLIGFVLAFGYVSSAA